MKKTIGLLMLLCIFLSPASTFAQTYSVKENTVLRPTEIRPVQVPNWLSLVSHSLESEAARIKAERLMNAPVRRARYANWLPSLIGFETVLEAAVADGDAILRMRFFDDVDLRLSNWSRSAISSEQAIYVGEAIGVDNVWAMAQIRRPGTGLVINRPGGDIMVLPLDGSLKPESNVLIAELGEPLTAFRDQPENFDENGRSVPFGSPEFGQKNRAIASTRLGLQSATPVIDVLVLYTSEVLKAVSKSIIDMQISNATASANRAFSNSGIGVNLFEVGRVEVSYTGTGDTGTDLGRLQRTNDGFLDHIHLLRDRSAADIVVLITERTGGGKANLAVVSSDADDDSAFAIVGRRNIPFGTFTHEIGHIAGAHHNWADDPFPLPPYAHGARSTSGGWRTVMSYDCNPSCTRLELFSTPNRSDAAGRPFGSALRANNARRLNETATTLEGFRIRGPRISLYEGPAGTQDHVCVLSLKSDGHFDFSSSPNFRFCDNDEARSARLFDVPAGRVIRLYDDSNGRNTDDWLEIVVKRPLVQKRIDSFERSFEDADVRVQYHHANGLNGKVSRASIVSAPSGPMIDFYEGNGATQDLICSVDVGATAGHIDFRRRADCDNDEARSAVLFNMPRGMQLRFWDTPWDQADDVFDLSVRRNFSRRVLNSFEFRTLSGDAFGFYQRHNGLDGKVTAVDFSRPGSRQPSVILFEGNNASQNVLCRLPANVGQVHDLTSIRACENDEARSAIFNDVSNGQIAALYDNSSGSTEDDVTLVHFKTNLDRKLIDTFDASFNDDEVEVVHLRRDGLDGKVSRVEFFRKRTFGGRVAFYSNDNARGSKLCELSVRDRTVNFKNHGTCDNDDARSVVLAFVRQGTEITLYDDPDCEGNDDFIRIIARQDIIRKTIRSLELTTSTADVRTIYTRRNGLAGKVSCVRISAP